MLKSHRSLAERFRIGASLIPPFALLWLAARQHWIPVPSKWFLIAMPAALIVGMGFPELFAGWHRGVERVQSCIGRWLRAILLGLVFVGVVVPVNVLLRILGKSFLRQDKAESYWKPARPPGSLRDQF